ncbi:HAD family hydrolase [Nocardia callitridis]|uniref:HAD family hydrolase n=1 Tax=Nocardia callitridis TaxID=648753 RepID=A0ABP9KC40_9NOCA
MTISAVLFDFSGTLFRLEEDQSWFDEITGTDGKAWQVHEKVELMRRMTAPVEQVVEFDAEQRYAWENRDLDPRMHRIAMLAVLRGSGVPTTEQAEGLYGRLLDPMQWTPYPDCGAALKQLAARGIPVGVVSNIPFDIRPAFAARGWDEFVAAQVLSFEVGAIKPEPKIFRVAVDRLGADAASTLMVGDSAEADGGATALGCRFALVDPLPTGQRPTGLLDALRAAGVLAGPDHPDEAVGPAR